MSFLQLFYHVNQHTRNYPISPFSRGSRSTLHPSKRFYSVCNYSNHCSRDLKGTQSRKFSSFRFNDEEFSANTTRKIGLILLISGFFTSSCLIAQEMSSDKISKESFLLNTINAEVLKTIYHASEIPGLNSEVFTALKPEIINVWKKLCKDGSLEVSGTDAQVRPSFVALQAVIEGVLAAQMPKNVKFLKGIILTPMPATPLCSKGEISKELVDSSMEADDVRLFTVKARTTIVRDYLHKGGDLHVAYPKEGYYKRTEEQQKIFKEELEKHPNHLFADPLNCEEIPQELIGAIYLFQDTFGNEFVFGIKMTQAKDPQEIGNFGLWYGSVKHPGIQKRLQALNQFLEQCEANIHLSKQEN